MVGRPRAVPGARGIPPRPLPGRRRPPGVQPHRRRARHRPQRARPGDGVAGPRPARARGGVARRRGGGRLPSSRRGTALGGRRILGRRHPPLAGGRGRPRDAAAAAGAARGRARGCCCSRPGPSRPRSSRRCTCSWCSGPGWCCSGSAGRCCAAGCPGASSRRSAACWWRAARSPCWRCRPPVPGGYWYAFWTEPGRRTVYVTVAVALFLWLLVATAWALSVTGAAAGRRAPCSPRSARGWPCRPPSSGPVGLERALTAWNDQVGLLPVGALRASWGSRSTSASRPTPRGGRPGSGRGARRRPAARAPGPPERRERVGCRAAVRQPPEHPTRRGAVSGGHRRGCRRARRR